MKRLGHVDGFCGPEYESFKTREEAQAFLAATPMVPQSQDCDRINWAGSLSTSHLLRRLILYSLCLEGSDFQFFENAIIWGGYHLRF